MVERGQIWLVNLDPTRGSELKKTRPCVIISPFEMHSKLRTVIIAPMTTGNKHAPYRIPINFEGEKGLILLDQIRAIDKLRLVKLMGTLNYSTLQETSEILQEVFSL